MSSDSKANLTFDCKGHTIQHVLRRNREKRDADFCYLFVCNTLFQWQSIDTSDIDPQDENEAFFKNRKYTDLIEGMDIRETFEIKGMCLWTESAYGKTVFREQRRRVAAN